MRILIRLLGVFLVIWAVLALVRGLFPTSSPSRRAGQPQRPQSSGRLVKDPVCGTYVAEGAALAGSNEFFCSEECRRKFLNAS